MRTFIFTLLLLSSFIAFSQSKDRKIEFPDIPGYQTLVCDLHQHTAFSDGSVWPDIRIQEAVFDGVDVIALTEHLEYQPHVDDIPHPDRNRSYELAKDYAKDKDLIIIHGAEITRSMPPGHCNAIFINDANKLLMDDPMAVFREAKNQGAFVFWNHPNWTRQKPDGAAELTDMHRELISENLLHGIEVVNEHSYSDEALEIALGNNLTIMATSDIHGLIDWAYDIPNGGHRPVTLVFANERSEKAIKDGLTNGRTVAWHNNTLIGKEEYLKPLIQSSIRIKSAAYMDDTQVAEVIIENVSDADLIMQNQSPYRFHLNTDLVTLKGHEQTTLLVKTKEIKNNFDLSFIVLNAYTNTTEHPELKLSIEVK